MEATESPPAEITLPQAARLLGCSWPVAYARLLEGQIEGRQVAGRWLCARASVERFRDQVTGSAE